MTTPTLELLEPARTEGTRRADSALLDRVAAGLCRTCSKEPDCTLRRDATLAVIHCDELDPLQIPMLRPTGVFAAQPTPVEDEGMRRGLCVNCERSANCTFPGAAEGVWRCEEYL